MKIVILSGAGLSAGSGISTFRGLGSLWENHKISDVCSIGCLSWNEKEVISFYNQRRDDLRDKVPNEAHKMIARLSKFPEVHIYTQNIDNLLEKAGTENPIHVHGKLNELVCESCKTIFPVGYEKQETRNCVKCGDTRTIRPNVVFTGEPAPEYSGMYSKIDDCDLLVVIGTSGEIIKHNEIAEMAKKSIICNLDKGTDDNWFDEKYYMDASEASPIIEEKILKLLEKK